MGWDVGCILCGIRAGDFVLRDHDELENQMKESGEVDWMEDVRLLGINPESSSEERAWLSGKASFWDYGSFEVVPPDHPEFIVGDDETPLTDEGEQEHRAFLPTQHKYCFPLHVACFDTILSQVIHAAQPALDSTENHGVCRNINLQILHDSLMYLLIPNWSAGTALPCTSPTPLPKTLVVNYGLPSGFCNEQFYTYELDHVDLVADPTVLPERLARYEAPLDRAKNTTMSRSEDSPRAYRSDAAKNVLTGLPMDVLFEIFIRLPHESIQPVQMTCRSLFQTMSEMISSNWYWKYRIHFDFAFLGEWLPKFSSEWGTTIEWKTVYKDLGIMANRSKTGHIPNLSSRRRIWNVCCVITTEYLARLLFRDSHSHRIIRSVIFRSPQVTRSIFHDVQLFEIPLKQATGSIGKHQMQLTLSFNAAGILSSIRKAFPLDFKDSRYNFAGQGQHQFDIRDTDEITGLELTVLKSPSDGGIVGIVLNMAKSGKRAFGSIDPSLSLEKVSPNEFCKRLLQATDGYEVVGLQGRRAGGIVSNLGLLEAERKPVRRHCIQVGLPSVEKAPSVQDWLRKTRIPCTSDEMSKAYYGPNSILAVGSAEALEYVSLAGESRVTRFSATMTPDRIEVEYDTDDGLVTHTMGPHQHGLKHLRLSYKDGEQIWAAHVTHQHQLCIVTNWGRQMFFGDWWAGLVRALPPDPGRRISGIFGSFCERTARPLVLGTTYKASPTEENPNFNPESYDEVAWEPNKPPITWSRCGEMIPHIAHYYIKFASWLDFTRPCRAIDLCFAHAPSDFEYLPLLGITMQYVREEPVTIGMVCERISRNEHPEEDNWLCACGKGVIGCSCGLVWQTVRWEFRNSRIRHVLVWPGKEALRALQLVLTNGRKSPIWGTAEDAAPYKINIGVGEGQGIATMFNQHYVSEYRTHGMFVSHIERLDVAEQLSISG